MSSLYTTCKRDCTYILDKVIPGLICAALFDSDQSWYRAKVISQVGQSSYSVLFVDYGNVETVALMNMRKLDGSLFQYAALAVPVQIEELKALAESWGQVEQGFFEEKVIEEQFTVKFNISNSNRASVTLIDANGDDIVDVIKRALSSSPGKARPEGRRHDQMKMETPSKPLVDAREIINARSGARPASDGKQFGRPTSPQGASGGGFDRNRLGKPHGQGDHEPRGQMSNGMQRSNFPASDERRQNGAVGFDQNPDRFQQNTFAKGGSFGNQRGDRESQGFKSGGRNFDRDGPGTFSDQRSNRRNESFGQGDRANRNFIDRNERTNDFGDQGGFGNRERFGNQDDRGFGNRDSKGFGAQEDRGFANREEKGFANRDDKGTRRFGEQDDRGFGSRQNKRFGNREDESFDNRENKRFGSQEDGGFGSRGGPEERSSGSRPERSFGDRNQRNFGGGDKGGFGGQSEGGGFQNRREGGGDGGFGRRDDGSFQNRFENNVGNRKEGDRDFGVSNRENRGPRRTNDSDPFSSSQMPGKTRREHRGSNSSSEQSVFSSGTSKPHSNQLSSNQTPAVPNTGESFVLQDYDKFLPAEPVVCRVCNFKSPSNFLVVIVEEFTKMSELVKQYLSTPQNVKRPQKVEANFCYLLPTGQTSGRRAEVVSIVENVEKCVLFCCDIGSNKPDVSIKQLLSLDVSLASTCKLVIKSRLHGLIGPVTIAEQEGEWTLSAFNKFKELTEKKEVKVSFKGRDSSNVVTVDILLQDDQLMSELFLEKNFAVARKEDDELENANHYAAFSAEDENSTWLQGHISPDNDLACKLLCLETSHIWVAHADRDKLLKNLQEELKTTFDKHGADKLLIKKPLLNSCYTAKMANKDIQRCRVEKIEEANSFVVRFIDFGTCERVAKVHLLPSFAAKVPYLAKRVPINPDLEKLISPFVMFELSITDSVEVKLKQDASKEFANVFVNGKDLSDEILKLASKMYVDFRSFECDQVQLRVIEVAKVETGNCFNAVVVETEVQAAENAALQKELDSFYGNSDSAEVILPSLIETNPLIPEEYELSVGSFIVHKNENSESESSYKYCRGEIIEVGADGSFAVRSIDHATTQKVAKEHIRKITSNFCEKSAIAVQCSTTTHASQELEEFVGQEVEVSLLHLGRINIVSIAKGPEPEEVEEAEFAYPSTHSIDIAKQPITISDFVSPVELSYSLSRFDSEIANIGEEIQMIWEEQEIITEEDILKHLIVACEVDSAYYRVVYDSEESQLHLIDVNKKIQKPLTEVCLKKLPKFLQTLPVFGQRLQISGLIPIEDESFVDLEKEIAKYDVTSHFCSFEDNSGSDFRFGTKLYCKYLVDDKLARTNNMEEVTRVKYKSDIFEIDSSESAEVVVSAVDRKNIWVQVAATEEAVDELQIKLAGQFNGEYLKRPHCKLRRPKTGKVCATKFAEDDCWYRAEVIEPDETQKECFENNFVPVRFVDFGNTQTTDASVLYSLPEDFVESPKYALKVTVPNMEELMNFDLEKHLNENIVGQKVKLSNLTVSDEVVVADVEFGCQNLIDILKFVKSNPKIAPQNMTNVNSINATVTFVCENATLYIQNSEAAQQLAELMEKLKAAYSNLGEQELQLEDIDIGEFLVVKSPEDEEIYRAKLMNKKDSEGSEVFEVLLIDYGNSLECPIDVCWKLSRDFASEPPHAYHCAIFDCDFKEEKLEDACELLSQMLESDNAVECEFQVRIEPLMVDIKFQENWITETVAQKELVEERTTFCDMKYLDSETVAEETKCLLVSAKDPNRIVLQLSGEVNDRLTLLQEDLNRYYLEQQEVESLVANELTEGCVLVGYDKEFESSCRAVVENVETETEMCQLRFVDWGRTCKVPFGDLKPLRKSFLKGLRPQGIQVALNGVLPDEDGDYLGSDQAVIEKIIGENELIVGQVGVNENGLPLVEIKLSGDESDLKQRLIDAEICRDSSSAPMEWPTLSKSFYDLDVGSKTTVNVASVDKEGLYVQLENHLEDLGAPLAKYESERKMLRRPKVGKLCVSKFAEDGLYYRAEILKIEDGFAEILFVDYRNEERCKLEELFEMSKELVAIPGCCIRALFKPEVSELINFDVLHVLSETIIMTAETPKKSEIEVLKLLEDSLLVEFSLDGESLMQEIDRIRAHPVVTLATMKNSDETGFLLSNFENVSSLYLIREENIPKREEFIKKMTSFYNHLTNSEELKIEQREFTPGAHVAVKIIPDANPLESNWSRASVENILADGSFKLRLLDTGACIHKSNLELCRKLTNEFAVDQETFVVKCKLYQVLNKPDSNVSQKVIEIIKAVDHVPFSVISVSRTSDPQAIDIYVDDEKTLTEVLIAEDLVDAGAACKGYKRHEKLEIGSSLEVCYTDCSSPYDIRFQLVTAHDKLTVLEEDIRSSVEFASDIEGVTAPKVCLAQSGEDQQWYRGLVEEISTQEQGSQNHIEVMFVDWGNSEWVSIENIKEIASEFCELPAQSISCTVAGIIPVEGEEWVADDKEVLEEILSEAQKIEVVIQEFEGTHVKGDCNVDGSSLVTLLVDNKVARDPQSTQKPVFEHLCWSKFDLEAGSEVPVWVSAVEPANISWSLEIGSDGKVIGGNWRHASHMKCEQFDKNFVWIQLDSNDDDLNQMNEYISKNANSYKRLRRARPGRMGAMKSEVLQCWIRVQVLSVEENEEGIRSAFVRAVDYGHTEKLANLNDLKELPEKIWKKYCFCLSLAMEDLEIENINIDVLEDLRTILVFNENETITLNVTSVSSDSEFPFIFGTLAFRESSLRNFIDSLNAKPEILSKGVSRVQTGSPPASYFISHFEDPQNIHLQLASDYESLSSLLSEMNEFYTSLEDGRLLASDLSQEHFVSFYEGDQWKRGVVEKLESPMTQIRDVDTGKLHSLEDKSMIRKLKNSFAAKPMFSFCASLFALNPTGSNGWDKPACQDIVHANIPASGEVIAEMFSDGKNVILKLDGKDLAQQLIEKEIAAPYEISASKIAPNATVKENATLPCVLVDVETPNEVLFQVAETNEDLISFEQDLFSFYENGSGKTMVFGIDDTLLERTCVIKSQQDDSWHRAFVKSCEPGPEEGSEEQCKVFLVDWGNSETLPRSQIFPTLEVFVSRLQSQAIIANLVSIVPDELDEDWVLPDDVDTLKTLMGEQEGYNVKIGLVDQEKQVAFADVILEDEQSLCSKAVEAGFARFTESEGKISPTFKTLQTPFSENEWVECKLLAIDAEKIVVSPIGKEGDAEKWLEEVNELIANGEIKLRKLRRVKRGRICIAVLRDELYYRAEIIKVDEENADHVDVFLVDFGEFSTVSRKKCFEVNDENYSSLLDPEKCTISIKQILSASEFTEAIETEIWDSLNLETSKLNVKILDKEGTEPLTGEVKINKDLLSEFVLAISTPNINLPPKESPEVGSKIMAAISFQTPNCFFIQIQNDVDVIETIQAGLQEKYNNSSEVTKFSLDQDLVKVGSIVACKCSEDSNWYRAEIAQLEQNSKYKVQMIDYGFTDQVLFANLCRLDRKFHSQPPLAMRCVLNGVSLKVEDGYQSEEVLEVLQYDEDAEYYEMEVNDVIDGMVKVSYNHKDEKTVAEVLIEKDFAKNEQINEED